MLTGLGTRGDLSKFNLEEADGYIYVKTPYDRRFVEKAKEIDGAQWTPDRKVWRFPDVQLLVVLTLVKSVYGVQFKDDSAAPAEPEKSRVDSIMESLRVLSDAEKRSLIARIALSIGQERGG